MMRSRRRRRSRSRRTTTSHVFLCYPINCHGGLGTSAALAGRLPWPSRCLAGGGRLGAEEHGRCYLMTVAFMRNVFFSLEQPRASMLVGTPQFQYAISLASATCQTVFLGGFGAPSPKPIQVWATGPGLSAIARSKKASDKRLGTNKIQLAVDQRRVSAKANSAGNRSGWKADKWVGGKKSRQGPSEHYPIEFCYALATCVVDRLSGSSKLACAAEQI